MEPFDPTSSDRTVTMTLHQWVDILEAFEPHYQMNRILHQSTWDAIYEVAGADLEATRNRTNPPTLRSAVLKIFSMLPEDHPSPVKQIAQTLGLPIETVAAILSQYLGDWDPSQEPDL